MMFKFLNNLVNTLMIFEKVLFDDLHSMLLSILNSQFCNTFILFGDFAITFLVLVAGNGVLAFFCWFATLNPDLRNDGRVNE